MIEQAIRIGTFANIPVRIHWSFLLIIAYIVSVGVMDQNSSREILIQICFTMAMFACVVLHEFGHALTARRFGVQTEDIILLPIGGVARLHKLPEKPVQELLIAVMGPVVNLIIAIVILIALWMKYGSDTGAYLETENYEHFSWGIFLPLLMISNILLMVFNLIPAFPMDGGRVLRALVSMKTSRLNATRWATRIGQIICILFIIAGIYFEAWTTILIGIFIFLSASAEYRQVAREAAYKNKTAASLCRKPGLMLTEYISIGEAREMVMQSGQRNFAVMDITGRITGTVSASMIGKAFKENSDVRIKDIMHTPPAVLMGDDEVLHGIQYLEQGIPAILVFDHEQLTGLLDLDSIRAAQDLG